MHRSSSVCRADTRSLIWGVAVALLAQALATADEPKAEDLSAIQILHRMEKGYAECKSYRDTGSVKIVFVRDNENRTDEGRMGDTRAGSKGWEQGGHT